MNNDNPISFASKFEKRVRKRIARFEKEIVRAFTAPLNISSVVLSGQDICAPELISTVNYLAIKP